MSDKFNRTIFHRLVTVNDTVAFTLAQRVTLEALKIPIDRTNGLLSAQGAEHIEFGFYGIGNDNGTFVATLIGLPPILERLPGSQQPKGPRPLRLGAWTLTLGTSTETNERPVDGVSDTGTWRAPDDITANIEGCPTTLYDVGFNSGVSRLVIDPLQCPLLWMFVSSMANVTKVAVSARRMLGING